MATETATDKTLKVLAKQTAAQAALKRVQDATQWDEKRDCRGMGFGEAARQGDVYIVKVRKYDDIHEIYKGLKATAKKIKGTGIKGEPVKFEVIPDPKPGALTSDRQLAPGTSKGSRHIIADDHVQIFEPRDGASNLEGPYITSKEDWTLTHPEHANMVFGAGKFVCIYQRDFTAEHSKRQEDLREAARASRVYD